MRNFVVILLLAAKMLAMVLIVVGEPEPGAGSWAILKGTGVGEKRYWLPNTGIQLGFPNKIFFSCYLINFSKSQPNLSLAG